MSILVGTAFGLQTFTAGMEWESTGTAPTLETTLVRSNGTAARFAPGGGRSIQWNQYSAGQGVKFYRAYVHLVTAPAATRAIISIDNAANLKIGIRLTSARLLQLFNEEDFTQIGSDSSAINTGEYYRIELKVDSTTLASTAVEARLYAASAEETLLWNPSGTANLTADPNRYTIGNRNDANLDFVATDLTINDDQTSFMNTWPGQGSLVYLRPDGNSGTPQWTRGGADSGANWSQMEETTPNDATDYVESNTSGQIDDYTLAATPAAVNSDDVINWVVVMPRFAVSATTGGDPDFVVRLTSGASTDESGNLSGAGSTLWETGQTITSRFPLLANNSNYEQPGGSSAWTKAALDSATMGIRESVTDTHFIRVSAVWLIFDHKPSSGTQYPQSVAGTLTTAGTVVKQGNKPVAGTLTSAGALIKQISKLLAGALSPAGTVVKQTNKPLAGMLTSAGVAAAVKIALMSLAGTLTSSGILAPQAQKALSGTLTSAGTLINQASKILAGVLPSTGIVTKQTNKPLAGTLTPAGVAAAVKIALMSLAGTLGLGGLLGKQTGKPVSGTLTSSGMVVKQTGKPLAGGIAPEGGLVRLIGKMLAGALTPAGIVAGVKSGVATFSQAVGGVLSFAGELVTEFIRIVTAQPDVRYDARKGSRGDRSRVVRRSRGSYHDPRRH